MTLVQKRPSPEADGVPTKRHKAVARVVVCGAGWWAQQWLLPQLHRNPESAIVAIVEPNPSPKCVDGESRTTEELHQLYGVPIFYSIDELLDSDLACTVDGIIISSIHASHHEIGMKSMKARWHILMEKPMTTEPLQAYELAFASAAYSKVFMVNNTANFRENSKRAHDLVKDGQVGEVKHVSCAFFAPVSWVFENPANIGWVKPTGSMLGNGFGWGQMSHAFGWVFMVTGLTPKTAFCHMGYSEKTGADLYNSATVRCTNGATVSVQGVASMPGGCKVISNTIFGTEGMLSYSGNDGDPTSGALVLQRHDKRNRVYPGFHFENLDQSSNGPESLQSFVAGCLGRPFFNAADADVGYKAVLAIDAMYKSAKSGMEEAVFAAQ